MVVSPASTHAGVARPHSAATGQPHVCKHKMYVAGLLLLTAVTQQAVGCCCSHDKHRQNRTTCGGLASVLHVPPTALRTHTSGGIVRPGMDKVRKPRALMLCILTLQRCCRDLLPVCVETLTNPYLAGAPYIEASAPVRSL